MTTLKLPGENMMRNGSGLIVSFCALLLLTLTSTLRAETVRTTVWMSPENVLPPLNSPPIGLSGHLLMTLDITRNSTGNITGGTAGFLMPINYQGTLTVTDIHLHDGAVNGVGPPLVNIYNGSITLTALPGQTERFMLAIPNVGLDVATVQRLLANPARLYADFHSPEQPEGSMRGQFHRFTETLAGSATLSTLNQVPPIPEVFAWGNATITVNPTRNSTGQIDGGSVTFSVFYLMPADSEIIGFHVHKQVAGMNGEVVIDSGLTDSNSIVTPTGSGPISITVPVKGDSLEALKQLIEDPTGFYLDIHTKDHGSGLTRGQLASIAVPPEIHLSDTAFLTTAEGQPAEVELMVTGFDFGGLVLINGFPASSQQVQFVGDDGRLSVLIPSQLRATGGTLFVQLRSRQGILSAPYTIVVSPANQVNSMPATTVDAAKYGPLVAPESIAAAFGIRLASQAVTATDLPLPNSLDGTTVYVNGVAAGLFYVSDPQANYVIPPSTPLGPAEVVIVAKDGTVSRGAVNVAGTIPAIFTQRADGTGAPAAVASADGQNFDLPVSNPDGCPAEIEAGNYVMLFGTGMRFASTAMTINIGGTEVTPMFFGPQDFYEAADRVNFRIPQSLAGSGVVDLVLTLDGKTSNTVKLKIR